MMRRPILVAAIALGSLSAAAQTGLPADRFPKPARPVASIISDRWASEDTRERIGEAATVMRLLDIKPGTAVADIGAGSGYYTVRLSARVGPTGRVYAEDIIPLYLEALQRRVTTEGLANVAVSMGASHDPGLPPQSVDVALLVHMYHEIDQPYGLLANLVLSLRPGGRVGILDANRPTLQHGTPPDLLRCELQAVGYREVGFHPLEDGAAYLAVFEPPARVPDTITPCP